MRFFQDSPYLFLLNHKVYVIEDSDNQKNIVEKLIKDILILCSDNLTGIKEDKISKYTSLIKEVLLNIKKDVSGVVNVPNIDHLYNTVIINIGGRFYEKTISITRSIIWRLERN